MFFGMGTVFVFLSLLVICTFLMSSLINRIMPEAEKVVPVTPNRSGASTQTNNVDVPAHIKTVISLAIKKHRAKK